MSALAAWSPAPYPWLPARSLHGLGDETTAVTGTVLTSLAPVPVAGPFLAAAGQLVALFGNLFSGCGATCTQATTYANQAGAQLDQLMQQYFAQPVHYQSTQTAYLNAVTQIIAWLQQMCGNPALGNAGKRCIAERLVRRACPSTLNDSNIGGAQIDFCDYYSVFYDPVANDPNVVPDPVTGTGTSATATTGASVSASDVLPLLILAGIGIAVTVML